MLALFFSAAGQRYAMDSRSVVEVVPRVVLRTLPKAPPYIAGIFRYRGSAVPVVDLCRLMGDAPCRNGYGTRILLVHFPSDADHTQILGLLAEDLTRIGEIDEEGSPAGFSVKDAPYLDSVHPSSTELIQTVRVEDLLPEDLKSRLFTEAAKNL